MVQVEKTEREPEAAEDQHAEQRRQVRRALKVIEQLREVFGALGAADRPEVAAIIGALEKELDALKPPDPRRCKEFLRAVGRARKGLVGIAPEDVVLYCRCFECTTLRTKLGLTQPAGALEVEAPEEMVAAPTETSDAPEEGSSAPPETESRSS